MIVRLTRAKYSTILLIKPTLRFSSNCKKKYRFWHERDRIRIDLIKLKWENIETSEHCIIILLSRCLESDKFVAMIFHPQFCKECCSIEDIYKHYITGYIIYQYKFPTRGINNYIIIVYLESESKSFIWPYFRPRRPAKTTSGRCRRGGNILFR